MNATAEAAPATTPMAEAWDGFCRGADGLARSCGDAACRAFSGARPSERHSPALAAILSFVLPGLGQAYNGEVGKGVLFLVGWVLIVPWALAVMDAFYVAKLKNLEARLADVEPRRE